MKNVLLVVAVNLLLLLAIPGLARHYAPPDKVINGKVTNEKGDPVDNATVQVKGSRTSTKTKSDGTYSIRVDSDSAILVFSFVGFDKQELAVAGKSSVDAQLKQADASLNDVIVVGYGTQKRSHLTGSVGTIEMKNIQDIPAGNLSEAIKGQMPNVSVSGGFSRPGQPATITIRNPKFFSKDGATGNPLYVIDDVFRTAEDFSALDASEVESLTVLKDAAAAIYGIQGANGVVIVKTKRGKPGATAITYNGSVGVSTAPLPEMMNGYQQAVYLNDFNTTGKKLPTDPAIYTPDELDYFKTHNYNWLDMAWKASTETRQTINLSGGSDKATYFAGLSYVNQNGNFSGTNFNRYTFRASTDIKLATGLKVALSLSGNLSDGKQVYSKQGSETLDNDWKTLVNASQFNPPTVNGLPILSVFANNGNSTIDNYNFFGIQNSGNFIQTKTNALNFQGQLTYAVPFLKGLTAGLAYNKNINNSFIKQFGTFYNTYQFSMLGDHGHIWGGDVTRVVPLDNGNRVRLNPTIKDIYQLNGTLNYSRSFGKHEINVLAAYEQSESSSDGVAGLRSGVILGALPNQGYATGGQTSDETQSQSARLAVIGRINYNYAGKYLAEFTYRGDANTNFAPENRWGYFPSLSLGWVISQESFFKNIIPRGVDFLKLRGSVGLLGSDNTKAYQYLASYALNSGKAPVFGGDNPRGQVIVASVPIPNRGVKWDDDTKINGGLDVKALRNRLTVAIDGYWDHRYNQLATLQTAVPYLIGAAVPTENYGISNAFGYEISVGWKDRINKDWGYNVTTFLSWSDNKVIKGDFNAGYFGTFQDPRSRSDDPGFMGLHALGMFRTQTDVDNYVAKHPGYTILGNAPKPGMLYYEDVRGPLSNGKYAAPDGKITTDDFQYLSSKQSNHYQMGFNWGVNYKTLSLNVLMNLGFGGYGQLDNSARKPATATSNRPVFWADHWTPTNTNASMPDPFWSATYDQPSDFWKISSTTFNVTNLNLSYTLPAEWVKKAGMTGARLYIVATNPFSLYNPYSYRSPLSSSYDVYPTLKSYSLGLNITL